MSSDRWQTKLVRSAIASVAGALVTLVLIGCLSTAWHRTPPDRELTEAEYRMIERVGLQADKAEAAKDYVQAYLLNKKAHELDRSYHRAHGECCPGAASVMFLLERIAGNAEARQQLLASPCLPAKDKQEIAAYWREAQYGLTEGGILPESFRHTRLPANAPATSSKALLWGPVPDPRLALQDGVADDVLRQVAQLTEALEQALLNEDFQAARRSIEGFDAVAGKVPFGGYAQHVCQYLMTSLYQQMRHRAVLWLAEEAPNGFAQDPIMVVHPGAILYYYRSILDTRGLEAAEAAYKRHMAECDARARVPWLKAWCRLAWLETTAYLSQSPGGLPFTDYHIVKCELPYDQMIQNPYEWTLMQLADGPISGPNVSEWARTVVAGGLEEATADINGDGQKELLLRPHVASGGGGGFNWSVLAFRKVRGGYHYMGTVYASRLVPAATGAKTFLVYQGLGGHEGIIRTCTHDGRQFICLTEERLPLGDGAPEENNERWGRLFAEDRVVRWAKVP